ncbi:MAG: response regulator, partial [Verrucomicrobia bacterium]
EWRIHHPQLGLRWVCGSSSPRVLENGDCVWDGYCFDITDRKAAEETLLREGKREAIERLAGGVAHDFNNYLTSLALAGDLLINDSDLPDRARKIAITICSEVSAAAAVARQLLAFTKDQPIDLESIPLAAFLTDCADFALRGSAMRAEVEVADPELEIVCDPNLLRQALFNLILNAREASNGKGDIHLSAAARAESTTLRVADTGPGIPEDERSKIFEPYFTTKATGSGLGLFVVRSILLRLGGDIELDPSAPQGACFVIQLPHRPLPAAPTPTQPPFNRPFSTPLALPTTGSDPASTFPTRVLLLEDDQQQTKLLLNFFEALKVSCQVFDSGDALLAAAPAYAAAGQSTLCILDITIRGARGGLEIAPALRKLLPEARLFLVSGYSADWAANEKSITGLGIVFIPKPYRLKELKRRLFGI